MSQARAAVGPGVQAKGTDGRLRILVTMEDGPQAGTAGSLVAELLSHVIRHPVAHEPGAMSL